ncbi:MAG: hypothetical protein ACRDLB_03995 [Actinomycetota bacterium]
MSLRWAMVVAAVVGTLAAAAGIEVRATYGAQVTADEPQYLLTAISLAEDGDLDVSDEIATRSYAPFHEITVDRQTQPLADGSEVSPHDPLLPAILAVPMEVGGWRAAKLTLAAINGALGAALVWLCVFRFRCRPAIAALVVSAFVASAPFAVYGNQVYPEIVAALAVTLAIASLTSGGGTVATAGLAASVIVLPWLSIKYVPVAAALALVGMVRLIRARDARRLLWLAGGLTAGGAVYAIAHVAWYGGLTPYAAGDHFVSTGEFSVVGTDVDLVGRSRRLVGLLVDDRFGLIPWQPAFLLLAPALGALFRRSLDRTALLVPLCVGWITATWIALTMQGWWWPGRQVVVVLPCAVIAIAAWTSGGPRRSFAFAALAGVGVTTYLWLVVEGLQGGLTWVVDFFETSNPLYRALSSVMPDYLNVDASTWILQTLWLVLLAGLGYWGYRNEAQPPEAMKSIHRGTTPAPAGVERITTRR